MREFKFRGWNGRNMSRICALHDNGIGALGNGGMIIPRENMPDTIMQYTGIKDRNGVEIYEGDILTEEYGEKYEVIWCEEAAQWYAHYPGDTGDSVFEQSEPLVECAVYDSIVGNIHQNPELLK